MRRQETSDLITIELQRLGQKAEFVKLPEDSTVEDFLEEVGLPLDTEVRCGADVVDLGDLLDDGDVLTIPTKKITQG